MKKMKLRRYKMSKKKKKRKKNEEWNLKKNNCLISDLITILAGSQQGFAKTDPDTYRPLLTWKKIKIKIHTIIG